MTKFILSALAVLMAMLTVPQASFAQAANYTVGAGNYHLLSKPTSITNECGVFDAVPDDSSFSLMGGVSKDLGNFAVAGGIRGGSVDSSAPMTPVAKAMYDDNLSAADAIEVEKQALIAQDDPANAEAIDIMSAQQAEHVKEAARLSGMFHTTSSVVGLDMSAQYKITPNAKAGLEVFINGEGEAHPSAVATYTSKQGSFDVGGQVNVGNGWAGVSLVTSF